MKKYLIASVVALTVALVASSANAALTRNLTVGSQGADVAELQALLISKGYSIPSISTGAAAPGYFGAQTKAAVMAYQAANGIPNTGFFGPLTMASINAGGGVTGGTTACPTGLVCTPTSVALTCPVGYTCTPIGGGAPVVGSSGLEGNYGAIADVSVLSQYADEEVGEGEEEVKVLGFEVEATNDGDILIRSIKVSFDPAGNASGDSDHLDDYIDGVSIWMGNEMVGSANVDDFNESSSDIFSNTITLDSGVIVKADETEDFFVTVDAVNSFDSSDIDTDAWMIDIDNIRFEDGSGVVTVETTVGDLPTDVDAEIDFVSFSTAADTELKISKDSSSPDENIVVIDEDDNTDDVVLLVGEIEIEGTSDVTIDEFPVTFTTDADSVSAVTSRVTLVIDGEEYSETVSLASVQTGTVTFDNLDLTISGGDTVEFTVMADINDINDSGVTATDLDEGDYLVASVSSTNRDNIDAENEEGDALNTSSERSGTATGDAQEFRTEGIGATLDTATATSNDSDGADTGTFKITYTVTAIGENVYIASLAADSVTYAVYDSAGTATTSAAIVASLQNTTDTSKTSVGNYLIEEGESETFVLTVVVPNGAGDADDLYKAALTGIKWDTSDDVSPANTYSSGLDEFQTPTVFLDNN